MPFTILSVKLKSKVLHTFSLGATIRKILTVALAKSMLPLYDVIGCLMNSIILGGNKGNFLDLERGWLLSNSAEYLLISVYYNDLVCAET